MMRNKLPWCSTYFVGLLALLASGTLARLSAKEIKLARHPDYQSGKIVFSYLGNLWLVDEDGQDAEHGQEARHGGLGVAPADRPGDVGRVLKLRVNILHFHRRLIDQDADGQS